jgi:hypothetical protein
MLIVTQFEAEYNPGRRLAANSVLYQHGDELVSGLLLPVGSSSSWSGGWSRSGRHMLVTRAASVIYDTIDAWGLLCPR